MYRGKGNTAATPRRRSQPQPEQLAVYIAESVRARLAEGRTYDLDDYGLADQPELIELVARALGVIS
jgi:hypothetical protein